MDVAFAFVKGSKGTPDIRHKTAERMDG